MNTEKKVPEPTRLAPCASRAVGVPNDEGESTILSKWYIAIVPNNTEKSAEQKLVNNGFETFVPSQKYVSIWKDGRRKTRERILIPGKVLIRCTEEERMYITSLSYINRFMVNKAANVDKFNKHPLAVVPDAQVQKCKFMLGQSDLEISFNASNIRRGTKVRVIRGCLTGLEGLVTDMNSQKTRIYVDIDFLGCASVLMDIADVIEST